VVSENSLVLFCVCWLPSKARDQATDHWLQLLLRVTVIILTLLVVPSVLWRCWLGGRKGIRPVKNWVVSCWCGYLSGARCRLAHAQLMPLLLTISCSSKIQIGFTFLVPAHPGSPGQRAVKRVCVCVVVQWKGCLDWGSGIGQQWQSFYVSSETDACVIFSVLFSCSVFLHLPVF